MPHPCSCCATVVPALLLLLLLAQPSASQEGAKVKFGARVEQAKSKCSGGSAKCQFGYTFKEESGRERNVIFVPPREEDEDDEGKDEERRQSAQKTPRRLPAPDATYFEMGREVGKRLRFDPRKRQHKDRAASVAKTQTPPTVRTIRPRPAVNPSPTKPPTAREQPVTIVIGGVSLVIPDFGLEPATSAQKPSPKPSRRPGARTRRPRPRISPSRFSAKQQPVPSQTTRRPAITPVQRRTTPSTFTSTLSSFEELTSTVDDFSNTLLGGRGGGRAFARGFVRNRVVTEVPEVSSSSSTTVRGGGKRGRGRTRARQRGSSERRKKPTSQDEQSSAESSAENLVEPELRGGSDLDPELRSCPGNLEGCVTACIPLDDVYVYSACVVECGKRCETDD